MEPYFRLDQLQDVAELPSIRRVLLSTGVNARDRKLLSIGLAAVERELELRVATNLHARYLIPTEDGSVLMLAISLGGIGKKVSTITSLGPEASRALRELHEAVWRGGRDPSPGAPRAAGRG